MSLPAERLPTTVPPEEIVVANLRDPRMREAVGQLAKDLARLSWQAFDSTHESDRARERLPLLWAQFKQPRPRPQALQADVQPWADYTEFAKTMEAAAGTYTPLVRTASPVAYKYLCVFMLVDLGMPIPGGALY